MTDTACSAEPLAGRRVQVVGRHDVLARVLEPLLAQSGATCLTTAPEGPWVPQALVVAALPRLEESLEVVRRAAADGRQVVVLHWSTRCADAQAVREAGGAGYLSKERDLEELVAGLEQLAAGAACWDVVPVMPGPVTQLRRVQERPHLTPREEQLLALVLEGLTTRQVASRLGIAEQSAKNSLARVMAKTGVSSRVQLFGWAVDCGVAPARHAV